MGRAFLFLVGFGLAVCGGISTIAYLNLTTTGLSFMEYLQFISKRFECYLLLVGMAMIWISIYLPFMPSSKNKT
ncbi:hypothetical protein [Bacillus timonensis]|uniref:hypothetical protein n=1 Tax=Bacillus timonensis TaxID=1033734 RepID=UPI00028943A5|nr:hypothetical protein [Bacillus timonensis]